MRLKYHSIADYASLLKLFFRSVVFPDQLSGDDIYYVHGGAKYENVTKVDVCEGNTLLLYVNPDNSDNDNRRLRAIISKEGRFVCGDIHVKDFMIIDSRHLVIYKNGKCYFVDTKKMSFKELFKDAESVEMAFDSDDHYISQPKNEDGFATVMVRMPGKQRRGKYKIDKKGSVTTAK